MERTRVFLSGLTLLFVSIVVVGCNPTPPVSTADAEPSTPALETRADSISMHALNALGGNEAFNALAAVRFNFGFDRGGEKSVGRKHLWNKHTGDYRIEFSQGADSNYVMLFNVNTREGTAYLNGAAVTEEENDQFIEQAYSSFINDTYWLLAPMKMLDPGVMRTYEADSSDADTEVVKMAFDGVGLTPGDQYWMYVNKDTGMLERWAFVLQGNPDAAASAFDWTEYKTFDTPAGPLTFSERKEAVGRPFALLTDQVAVYTEAPADMMTQTTPMLD